MEHRKQLRQLMWLMIVNMVLAGMTCLLRMRDGRWLLGALAGLTALASLYTVLICRKGL